MSDSFQKLGDPVLIVGSKRISVILERKSFSISRKGYCHRTAPAYPIAAGII
jgi:hypothetical protein